MNNTVLTTNISQLMRFLNGYMPMKLSRNCKSWSCKSTPSIPCGRLAYVLKFIGKFTQLPLATVKSYLTF